MLGRLLLNGNIGSPSDLMDRVKPWLADAAPSGRAPRVLLVTSAWGPGEHNEGGVKAALNAVGVPSRWVDGYDQNIRNLSAWTLWRRYLAAHPRVSAETDDIERLEELTRGFYVQETAFFAEQVRRSVQFARERIPGFSLGALPEVYRGSATPAPLRRTDELLAEVVSQEILASLHSLRENDGRMLAGLTAAEDLIPARTGLRLDPSWLEIRAELSARISEADVIFFFGGDPPSLTDALRFFDLRPALLDALRRGATFIGSSAGTLLFCERQIIFNDRSSDPLARDFRLYDRGFGFLGGLQIFPHCHDRIQTDDPDNLAYLARRFGTHRCAGLNEESFLLVDFRAGGAWSVGAQDGVYIFGPDGQKARYNKGERVRFS